MSEKIPSNNTPWNQRSCTLQEEGGTELVRGKTASTASSSIPNGAFLTFQRILPISTCTEIINVPGGQADQSKRIYREFGMTMAEKSPGTSAAHYALSVCNPFSPPDGAACNIPILIALSFIHSQRKMTFYRQK